MNTVKQNSEKKKFSIFSIKEKIIPNIAIIIIIAVTALIIFLLFYIDFSTSDLHKKIDINNFEAGKVSDQTIITDVDIAIKNPNVTLSDTIIPAETKIIRKGFIITETDMLYLREMLKADTVINYDPMWRILLFLALLLVFTITLYSKNISSHVLLPKEVIFLCINFVVVCLVAAVSARLTVFSNSFLIIVMVPVALSTMLTAVLIGQSTALISSIVLSLGIFAVSNFSIEPALFVLFSSFVSCRMIRTIQKRIDLIFASLMLALANILLLVFFRLIFPDLFSNPALLFVGVAVNGFFTGILALGLLTPLESLLNTASLFRLMDLSDLNTPIMKGLLLSASGTYNHSMLVATLAENACRAIGANPLLARVGAYYHDLGKMEQPEYFIENQRNGENPHNELSPRLSATILRRHVKSGVERARQLHLPQAVCDIIAEHHGTTLIYYFYTEAKKLDQAVAPEEFMYPGPSPSSKESAVVMLADTVEAACRTLDKPSVPRLEKFIYDLIMAKFEHHQFDNSNLTFHELDIIKNSFVEILAGYYHSRIEYPNQKDPQVPKEEDDISKEKLK